MNIIFSSCGNDSLALIQWAIEQKLPNLVVAYSNTKWSTKDWPERVERVRQHVKDNGGVFAVLDSIGFAELARRKKGFPANGMAWCSYNLKIGPAMKWLDLINPGKTATCYTGVMRLESASRKNWPEVLDESPNHGNRKLVSPMATWTLEQRNEYIFRAGFEILPTRSKECEPCVNINLQEIRDMDRGDVVKVIDLEKELGVGERSGKPKYMFRPHRMGGAEGFEQVKERADRGGGKYSPLQDDLFGCDSGFCGQ